MADQAAPDPTAVAQSVAAAQSAADAAAAEAATGAAGSHHVQPQLHDEQQPLPQPPRSPAVPAYQLPFQQGGIISDLIVDTFNDKDSALGSETSSVTTSLNSIATEFRFEHGRRYHAYTDNQYHLPNDEEEMSRLELQHLIWSAVFNGRLYLCPLPETATDALDIGCGTGAWAIEFAESHPHANILGTDLSPIQPTTVPLNCRFVIDDATQEWAFGQQFDLIHTRAITMGISDWDRLVSQAWTHLKPGGWLELQEFRLPVGCDDGSLALDSALYRWGQDIRAALGKVGIDSLGSAQHPDRMRRAGFANVQHALLKIPLGPWARGKTHKRIGIMAQKDLVDGLDGISTKLLLMLGYSQQELNELLKGAKDDLMNPAVHTYMPIDVSWGQKSYES